MALERAFEDHRERVCSKADVTEAFVHSKCVARTGVLIVLYKHVIHSSKVDIGFIHISLKGFRESPSHRSPSIRHRYCHAQQF